MNSVGSACACKLKSSSWYKPLDEFQVCVILNLVDGKSWDFPCFAIILLRKKFGQNVETCRTIITPFNVNVCVFSRISESLEKNDPIAISSKKLLLLLLLQQLFWWSLFWDADHEQTGMRPLSLFSVMCTWHYRMLKEIYCIAFLIRTKNCWAMERWHIRNNARRQNDSCIMKYI